MMSAGALFCGDEEATKNKIKPKGKEWRAHHRKPRRPGSDDIELPRTLRSRPEETDEDQESVWRGKKDPLAEAARPNIPFVRQAKALV